MIKIILGDVSYPKSEALIIPANTKGIMTKGVPQRISKVGLGSVSKEVKEFVSNNKVEVGQCFSSIPGRLNRRKLKRIYHAVIKRLQSDYTSLYIVKEALNNSLKAVVEDEVQSVTLCSLGIESGDLDEESVARIIIETCKNYENRVEIKIIDDNKEFISFAEKFLENK